MKFYQSKEFKNLQSKWVKKLEKSGFKDAEKNNQELRQYDRRNIRFENREKILNFFLKLDTWLNSAVIPKKHRRVLELWSDGKLTMVKIAKKTSLSTRYISKLKKRYKLIILTLPDT